MHGVFMKNLSVFSLAVNDHVALTDEGEAITADTPALAILTDFRAHKPVMLDSHLEAAEAREIMQAEDVRIKLVADHSKDVVGVISLNDLSEHNMLLKQMALHLRHDELLVRDLMHPRAEIRAVDYEQYQQATVGDVVSALQRSHQEYLLVVDKDAHQIRGLVCASDIARRLHAPIEIEKEVTFMDIFSAVTTAH